MKFGSQYLTTETQLPLDSSDIQERVEAFTSKKGSSSSVMSHNPIKSVIHGYLGSKRSKSVESC